MLHELGILAVSPELGIADKNAENFFIEDKQTLEVLLMANFVWIENSMRLLFDKVTCKDNGSAVEALSRQNGKEFSTISTSLNCKNHGLQDYPPSSFVVRKEGRTDMVKAFFNGDVVDFRCRFESDAPEQACDVTIPSVGAMSTFNLTLVSYVQSDIFKAEHESLSKVFEVDFLQSATLLKKDAVIDWTTVTLYAKDVKIYQGPPLPDLENPVETEGIDGGTQLP